MELPERRQCGHGKQTEQGVDFDEIFGGGFNASTNVGEDEYEPLPPGTYDAVIEEAGLKSTKSGTGKYVNLKLRIDKRVVFDRLNILNANAQAQQIGRRQLAKLCLAIGKPTLRDSSEMVGYSVRVRLAIEDKDNGRENLVKEYKAVDGAAPATPPSAPKAAAPAPAPATPPARRPWEKKAAPAPQPAPAAEPDTTSQEPDDGLPF